MRPWLLLLMVLSAALAAGAVGTYPRFEASFNLVVTGNPFDYTVNDVQVTFTKPDKTAATVPAFFDGGTTWRVRYTPDQPGAYTITGVKLNGAAAKVDALKPTDFTTAGDAQPGFVRVDAKFPTRFAFDNGTSYIPIGHDVAWTINGQLPWDKEFARMGAAGCNWTRVWMCHFDDRNLDWSWGHTVIGDLRLDVAKKWDTIIETAEKSHIYVQVCLQHHGQYSTDCDPNWGENPWNVANGGFLATPSQFFTDPKAIALTKMKYRYIVARWGYSPNVMGWELFNEVEQTEACEQGKWDTVGAWHGMMADFLRTQDPNRHLVTTSSRLSQPALLAKLDYVQAHAYPPDALAAINGLDAGQYQKPIFFGEFGHGDNMPFVHTALWGSVLSDCAGAAMCWDWERMNAASYEHYRSLADFLTRVKFADHPGARALPLVPVGGMGAVTTGPGGGFETAKQTDFTVQPDGTVPGFGAAPSWLQGNWHPNMFPYIKFTVDYPADGTFTMSLTQIARGGAHMVIAVDDKTITERDFPAADKDQDVQVTLEAKVPRGKHIIKVTDTGNDWVRLGTFTFQPYGGAFGAVGKADAHYAAAWLYARTPLTTPTAATLTVPGLAPGKYTVVWWDPIKGVELKTDTAEVIKDAPLTLTSPPVTQEVAVGVM